MVVLLRYFLQPRDNGKNPKPDDLGSLRLNVVYTEDHVFSSNYYSPLRDLLLKSADVEVRVGIVLTLLGSVPDSNSLLSGSLPCSPSSLPAHPPAPDQAPPLPWP